MIGCGLKERFSLGLEVLRHMFNLQAASIPPGNFLSPLVTSCQKVPLPQKAIKWLCDTLSTFVRRAAEISRCAGQRKPHELILNEAESATGGSVHLRHYSIENIPWHFLLPLCCIPVLLGTCTLHLLVGGLDCRGTANSHRRPQPAMLAPTPEPMSSRPPRASKYTSRRAAVRRSCSEERRPIGELGVSTLFALLHDSTLRLPPFMKARPR